MNDSREPKHATTALQAAAVEARKKLDPKDVVRFDDLMGYAERKGLEAFLLCAARDPDLPTVWRGYGSSVPYAIELDATVELLPVEQNASDTHPSPPSDWEPEPELDWDQDGTPFRAYDPDAVYIETQPWAAVRYDTKAAAKRVERIARYAADDPNPVSDVMVPWINLGGIDLLQMKHPAFKDEREARMIFDVRPRWKFVKFRASRFGLTPYIEVSAADGSNQNAINERFVTNPAQKLPILAVHIGPSPVGPESLDALREFLELHGYPDISVRKSTTPFR